MPHDCREAILGTVKNRRVARFIIESWCYSKLAGNVGVVTRSGVCVVVCIIGHRFGPVDWNNLLGKVVVISRRRVVRSSTLCMCHK